MAGRSVLVALNVGVYADWAGNAEGIAARGPGLPASEFWLWRGDQRARLYAREGLLHLREYRDLSSATIVDCEGGRIRLFPLSTPKLPEISRGVDDLLAPGLLISWRCRGRSVSRLSATERRKRAKDDRRDEEGDRPTDPLLDR